MAVVKKESYKVLKNIVSKDEKKALQLACEKLNTSDRFLKAMHTETMFIFKKIR